MSQPTTEELRKKATEALLLVHEFWMQLAMQMKRLEATNIESLEIRHQALLEIVKSGIREFQIVEQSTILEIKTINGPHLLRLLDLAAEADPESTGGNQ